jgi:DNA-binding MarR family transcriptional regulator
MWDDLDPRSLDSRDRDLADPRDANAIDPRDVFAQSLDLPRGLERERVQVHGHDYELRGSEVRTLATIGAFRVVPLSDLHDERGRPADLWHGDLDRLRSTGLIRVVAPLDQEERTPLLTLTQRGRELLDRHRNPDRDRAQAFYSGVLRSRELTHDAHLYRAYRRSAERLRAKGARIDRVVLDYELKREYQRFLQERNRHRSDSDGRPDRTREEIQDWAYEHQLPMDHDGVQFPDMRIEYEWPDGRRDAEDVEVTTQHYRGAHASAKARAGFTRYRARGARVGGRSGRGGGRSSDITLAEELLE